MACKNTCRLCDRLVISESVVYTAGIGLVIRIPAGSYNDMWCCRSCMVNMALKRDISTVQMNSLKMILELKTEH